MMTDSRDTQDISNFTPGFDFKHYVKTHFGNEFDDEGNDTDSVLTIDSKLRNRRPKTTKPKQQ